MKKILLFSLISLLACSSGVTANSDISCAPYVGQYKFEFTKTSGDCPDINNSIIDFDYTGRTGCRMVLLDNSANYCYNKYIMLCGENNYFSDMNFTIAQELKGENGSGTLEMVNINPDINAVYCKAIYNVKMNKMQK